VDCGAGTHLGTLTSSSQVNEQLIASTYSEQLELGKQEILHISSRGELDIMDNLMFIWIQVTTDLLRNRYMYWRSFLVNTVSEVNLIVIVYSAFSCS